MEDKNELSDIVLEKDNGKVLKIKRILIIIALLIIVFLGVLVTMKLINKPNQNVAEKIVLPPEPKSIADNKVKDEELFKQVPIIEENKTKKDNFENIVKNLKEKEIQKSQGGDQNQTMAPVVTQTQTIPNKAVAPVVEPIKKEVKKATPQKVASKIQLAKDKGIFVQVGAVSKGAPNKKFLKLITDKKYRYSLYPTKVNGKDVTKVLIGPFRTTKEAKDHMAEIKKSINKNAFIYRVK